MAIRSSSKTLEVEMNYQDLHKALDEAAYEVLVNYARRLTDEIEKLEAERRAAYDQIERIEVKGQEAV